MKMSEKIDKSCECQAKGIRHTKYVTVYIHSCVLCYSANEVVCLFINVGGRHEIFYPSSV